MHQSPMHQSVLQYSSNSRGITSKGAQSTGGGSAAVVASLHVGMGITQRNCSIADDSPLVI